MQYNKYILYKDGNKMDYVVSGCKRINRMTDTERIDYKTVEILIETDTYADMSSFIKSQLKRAATLYMEFSKKEAK